MKFNLYDFRYYGILFLYLKSLVIAIATNYAGTDLMEIMTEPKFWLYYKIKYFILLIQAFILNNNTYRIISKSHW